MASTRIYSTLLKPSSSRIVSRHVVSKRQSTGILFKRGFAVTSQTRVTGDIFSNIVSDPSINSTYSKGRYNPSSVPAPTSGPNPRKIQEERPVIRYALHIYASRNNTIMQFNKGVDTIAGGRVSSGLLGYKKSKRNSFEAGYAVALEVIKRATNEIKQHIPAEDLYYIKQRAEMQGFTGVLSEEDEARVQSRIDAENKALIQVRGYGFESEDEAAGRSSSTDIKLRPSLKFHWEGGGVANKPLIKIELVFNGYGQGRDAFVQALQGKESVFVKRYISRLTDQTKLRIGGHRPQKARRL